MAKVFPEWLHENINSSGEKLVYKLLKSEPGTENWIVLHSLLTGTHIKNRWGEIDFLILAPKLGIFVLEVKSGRIERVNGIWRYIDRFGRITENSRGPFVQARDAMYTLKKYLAQRYGKGSSIDRLLINYAVIFPHVEKVPAGIEIENYQLLINLQNNDHGKILRFIQNLSHRTLLELSDKDFSKDQDVLPNQKQIDELFSFFRPDFVAEISESTKTRMCDNKIQELTEKQYFALDLMRDNPRCFFSGAAGTGKTFLAIESFHRCIETNTSCIFLCSSKNLGSWLNKCCKTNTMTLNYVGSLSSFVEDFLGLRLDQKDILDCIIDCINNGKLNQFEKLILDEAQDILCDTRYLDILEFLIIGGWKNGKWNIFGDLEQQAIFTSMCSKDIIATFNLYSENYSKAHLDINCRNTRRIGEYVSLASGFKDPPFKFSDIEGELPVIETFETPEEQFVKLKLIIKKLIKNGVPPSLITILCESPALYKDLIKRSLNMDCDLLLGGLLDFHCRQNITLSTIGEFKGLENTYLIILDLAVPDSINVQKLFYTALSRAKMKLFLIFSSFVFSELNKKLITNLSFFINQ